MGLLEDVIGGVLNQTTRSGGQATRGGGMSPMMMAMMAFLAYRTLSGQKGGRTASAPDAGAGGLGDILGDLLGGGRAGAPVPRRGAAPDSGDGPGGGGLGDILGDLLGGGRAGASVPRRGAAPDRGDEPGGGGLGDILGDLLGGGRAGGGHAGRSGSGLDELSDIVDRFEQSGQGDVARSWVGRGENQPVSPSQMNALLDADTLDQLQAATGLDHDELLAGLAQTLPGVVDQLTPDGRLPTPQEWQRFGR
jgi:uncharacterized protein YidB (DUF937 family)